jgi:hypothetical protein
MKKLRDTIINGSLVLVSLLVVFFLLEFCLVLYMAITQPAKNSTPMFIPLDTPYLYGLNPDHHRINAHGLRDNHFSKNKPEDVYRILVLGDSIPFGNAVRSAETFPNQLETLLQERQLFPGKRVEVINSGVSGYTPYNELHYYLTEGRKFSPDLVIIAFCMNDIVNPRLHWNYTGDTLSQIPEEAIPNLDYDRNVIQPLMKHQKESLEARLNRTRSMFTALLSRTRTWQFISSRVEILLPDEGQQRLRDQLPDMERTIPTYITGEDNLSIERLMDPESSEWQWLRGMYDQIQDAVRSDGIPLAIAIFPLAYQMDPGYPHLPQTLFTDYCNRTGANCLDLLEGFGQHTKGEIFLLGNGRRYDIWHLTKNGHRITAEIIAEYLIQQSLLP